MRSSSFLVLSIIMSRLWKESTGSVTASPVSMFRDNTELSNSINPNKVFGELAARLSIDVFRLRLTAARLAPDIEPETSIRAKNDRPPAAIMSVVVSVLSGGGVTTKSVS